MVDYIQEELIEDVLSPQEEHYKQFLQERTEYFNQQKSKLDRLQALMTQRWKKLVEQQGEYSGQVTEINE